MSYQIPTERMEEALRSHLGYVYMAAETLGCSARTIYKRLEQVKSLRDVLDEVRGKELDTAELMLHEKIAEGDMRAIIFKLSTQGKDRGYVSRQEITGEDSEPIKFVVIRKEVKE